MCGIAGKLINNSENSCLDIVGLMCQAIEHRGPDNQGLEIVDKFVLGHRRLSIIDLSDQANMPMFSNDGNYCITYNGEFYNFKEIRKDLIRKGYVFRTKSDTEVLLNSYIEYKETMFEQN